LRFWPAQEIEVEILQRSVKCEVRPRSLGQIKIGFQVRCSVKSVFNDKHLYTINSEMVKQKDSLKIMAAFI
jgi:hypothetical protein